MPFVFEPQDAAQFPGLHDGEQNIASYNLLRKFLRALGTWNVQFPFYVFFQPKIVNIYLACLLCIKLETISHLTLVCT